VKHAKRRYRDRVEVQMEKRDIRCLWQGLGTITDYRGRNPSTVRILQTYAGAVERILTGSITAWFSQDRRALQRVMHLVIFLNPPKSRD